MKLSRWLALLTTACSLITASTALAQDPLKVGPELYKLVFENERVRVMEVTFAPGAKMDKHSHPDHFGYVVSAGKIKISRSTGDPVEADLKVGEVLWIPAETHWGENVGDTEVRIVITELKEPAPKKPAKKVKAS